MLKWHNRYNWYIINIILYFENYLFATSVDITYIACECQIKKVLQNKKSITSSTVNNLVTNRSNIDCFYLYREN